MECSQLNLENRMNTGFFGPQNLYKTYKIYKTYNGSTAPLTGGRFSLLMEPRKKKQDSAHETGGLPKKWNLKQLFRD